MIVHGRLGTLGEVTRERRGAPKFHLCAKRRFGAGVGVCGSEDVCQSEFKILAMLSEQRKAKGDGRGGRCQVDTKRYIASAHESPVQRGTDLYHSPAPNHLVIVDADGRAAQVQKSLRMPSTESFQLASLAKFLVRVDLSGFEQTISDGMATYIGSDHRFGHEV